VEGSGVGLRGGVVLGFSPGFEGVALSRWVVLDWPDCATCRGLAGEDMMFGLSKLRLR
jgi:hypothetical protein